MKTRKNLISNSTIESKKQYNESNSVLKEKRKQLKELEQQKANLLNNIFTK